MTKFKLRSSALEILLRVDNGGAFSHLLIDQMLKSNRVSEKDHGLLTEIVYGTIQRKLTLAYFVKHFVKKNARLDSWVEWLLYLSFYQMYYLERVPDHAVIHEAVGIAKERGHKGIASFVNGVLRQAQRKGFPGFENIADDVEKLSVITSHPRWLVSRWEKQYGYEKTTAMCKANLETKPFSARIQPLKLSREKAINKLQSEGYDVAASAFSNQGLVVKGNLLKSSLFQTHMVTIQDQSSMLVAEMMDLAEGMTVLDACSAPGGKTTHIAEKLNNTGQIHAYDLHDKKAKLVNTKAEQLELTNIVAKGADSRQLANFHEECTFDRILIDAPCSGLGVIRGKPDIKYQKKEKDITKLAMIQRELLEKISPLLKKDGKILYSTCTVDREENEQVVQSFLEDNPDYQVDPTFFETLPDVMQGSFGISDVGLQIFPDDFQTDGFFLTRICLK
ncbi:Ribosomal RNA small subunit methyltransferase B [Paraliobacillus sp. PM-2]|uniref:16S rRNA (cytosine(967)-C(5))-methyltransferase RsmB n=1 Tax=Paraliobacillus sp. PM-2 TaxID=1462524 RepID=UPI00061C359C|nr:16S rRNA (cytosine(967)-C(5))-methyltransferase RsmB [Paraliobacillus sp. PM-2]CQR47745.1 Ribosomal RNA small subunit methyltransferase B [Paraliobacillus sp. PM-2]